MRHLKRNLVDVGPWSCLQHQQPVNIMRGIGRFVWGEVVPLEPQVGDSHPRHVEFCVGKVAILKSISLKCVVILDGDNPAAFERASGVAWSDNYIVTVDSNVVKARLDRRSDTKIIANDVTSEVRHSCYPMDWHPISHVAGLVRGSFENQCSVRYSSQPFSREKSCRRRFVPHPRLAVSIICLDEVRNEVHGFNSKLRIRRCKNRSQSCNAGAYIARFAIIGNEFRSLLQKCGEVALFRHGNLTAELLNLFPLRVDLLGGEQTPPNDGAESDKAGSNQSKFINDVDPVADRCSAAREKGDQCAYPDAEEDQYSNGYCNLKPQVVTSQHLIEFIHVAPHTRSIGNSSGNCQDLRLEEAA